MPIARSLHFWARKYTITCCFLWCFIMSTSFQKFAPVAVSLACLIAGVLIGKSFNAPDPNTPPKQTTASTVAKTPSAIMTVEAVYPVEKAVHRTLTASGVIAGKDVAQVGGKVSGVAITAVLVDTGDTVKAGQVLARLDDSTLTEQTLMAKAELEQAQAGLDKARADLERVTPLVKIDAISREAFDAYKTAERQAAAQVGALTARLKSSRTTQNHTQIIAPVSGIISEKFAEVGMISTGSPLFSIVKNGTLEWQASVPTKDASSLALGQTAVLTVAGEKIVASVDKIAPITNNSREVTVHATLPYSPLLRGGMYQAGQFMLGTTTHATLPYSAVSTSDGMDYVWTLVPSDGELYRAERTLVNILSHEQDSIAVDLPMDTLVVAKSGNFLSDGSLVKILKPSQQTNPSNTPTQTAGDTP